ncbi:conserved hypothetical protein [Echinococcus multilocularis]|uniref:Uncharacterized protein n=1 Tax=Echinococcus multilocularis TaxID=6211 RepID=A0A068XUK1_ECHMU|nr:conserved hypothetical protein [Echinococcus multilocularis]
MKKSIFLLLWICLGKQQRGLSTSIPIVQKAPLLPYFNKDLSQVLTEENRNKALIAAIGNAFITWRENEPIELRIEYFCRTDKECHGDFRLNGSQKLIQIESFDAGTAFESTLTSSRETYFALVRLVPRRDQGIAIITFQLMVMENVAFEGHLSSQYMVHLQPPYKRVLTHGCKFRVQAYSKANLMIFHLNPNYFMPTGIKWQKFVIYKRVSVKKAPANKYIYVPLIVMTRSPFSTIPLTFYYFKEVTIELGDKGKLLVKGTTGNGLNLHDCGMYTVRWYTYERRHVVDEECEDTSYVAFWSQPPPTGPIFAHTKREVPEEWTFDLKELQNAVIKGPTSALVACVWTDVFQSIPKKRNFTLVITRRAFYSEGEELGFMMYAYLVNFTKPSLNGYVCYTESMALAGMRPYIPFPQEKSKYSVNPTVSVDNRHLRFTIRADYICEKKGTSKPFTGVAASESDAGYLKTRSDKPIGKDLCENPYQSTDITLPNHLPWTQGNILRFQIHLTRGSVVRVVAMDANNRVSVKPRNALYTQEVEVRCFEKRLRLLVKNGINFELEYLEMSGEVGPNNYLPIASYTPESGYEVNKKNIDSSAKLRGRSNDYHSLTLTAMAYHLHTFHGFRCRMKFRKDNLPEYEMVNAEPVCFVRRPPPIEMTVDDITVPTVEDESILQNRELQIFQTTCIQPETQLVFTCSQWREMETCDDLHTVDSVYNVDTDLIIYDTKRREYIVQKPVFDRLGRGRVDIPTVPYDWHIAEAVCHRTIRLADNISHIVIDQYSSAVRLCVTQIKFRFYLAHTGFEWNTGLTMSLEEMIGMNAVTEIDTDEVHAVDVGSAVICRIGLHKQDINIELARKLSPRTNMFTLEHGKKDHEADEISSAREIPQAGPQDEA